MNILFLSRRALIFAALLLAGLLLRADDDTSFTGGAPPVEAPVKKSVASTTHKTRARKKKHSAAVTAAATTNAMTNPAVSTNAAVAPEAATKIETVPTVATNEVVAPSTPTIVVEPNPVADETSMANTGRVATLSVADLRDYEAQPAAVQKLLGSGLALTTLNLSYKYGSSDPKEGGMDCSGTVYYLLRDAGIRDVPRDASEMYRWAWKAGLFQSVVSTSPDTFELERLKPGDLLFWTGTYHVERDPPVTHVMIYLGIDRHDGKRVMVGASEGRRFEGVSRYGVSVFDFTIPGAGPAANTGEKAPSDLQARFIGYASVPGMEELEDVGKPGP